MFKLRITYPSRSEELSVIDRMAHPAPPPEALSVAHVEDIIEARKMVDRIYMDEKIMEYILDLVIATRPGQRKSLSNRQAGVNLGGIDHLVSFGASPRASIALALAAKGLALLRERAFVLPQDVKDIAPDVLRHRLVLSYEAEAENIDADAVISRLLSELRTP
jgi:MoxR-like ATPase